MNNNALGALSSAQHMFWERSILLLILNCNLKRKIIPSVSENRVKFAEVEANSAILKHEDLGDREPGYVDLL